MTEPMTDDQATMILELQSAELEGRIPPIVAQEVSRLLKDNAKLREENEQHRFDICAKLRRALHKAIEEVERDTALRGVLDEAGHIDRKEE